METQKDHEKEMLERLTAYKNALKKLKEKEDGAGILIDKEGK